MLTNSAEYAGEKGGYFAGRHRVESDPIKGKIIVNGGDIGNAPPNAIEALSQNDIEFIESHISHHGLETGPGCAYSAYSAVFVGIDNHPAALSR